MGNVEVSDNLRWIAHGPHPFFIKCITVMPLMDVDITRSLMIRIEIYKIVEFVYWRKQCKYPVQKIKTPSLDICSFMD